MKNRKVFSTHILTSSQGLRGKEIRHLNLKENSQSRLKAFRKMLSSGTLDKEMETKVAGWIRDELQVGDLYQDQNWERS